MRVCFRWKILGYVWCTVIHENKSCVCVVCVCHCVVLSLLKVALIEYSGWIYEIFQERLWLKDQPFQHLASRTTLILLGMEYSIIACSTVSRVEFGATDVLLCIVSEFVSEGVIKCEGYIIMSYGLSSVWCGAKSFTVHQHRCELEKSKHNSSISLTNANTHLLPVSYLLADSFLRRPSAQWAHSPTLLSHSCSLLCQQRTVYRETPPPSLPSIEYC